jgi:hypothetical protein
MQSLKPPNNVKAEIEKLSETLKALLHRTPTLHYELEIRVWDKDGRLIATRRKRRGLMVIGVRKIITNVLIRSTRSASYTTSATDEGGTSRTFYALFPATGQYPLLALAGTPQSKIAVGSGTTAPADANYSLQTKEGETDAVSVTELSNGYKYGATITFATAKTITESAFFGSYNIGTDPFPKYNILLARDTFTAVNVPAGGSVGITYKFLHASLPPYELIVKAYDKDGRLIATRHRRRGLMVVGFRRIVAYAGIYSIRSANYNTTATDEGGTSRTFNVGGRGVVDYQILHNYGTPQSKIAVGSGTTAPADANYSLQTKEGETDAVTQTELSNGHSYGATITFTVAKTITESGYFGSYTHTGGARVNVLLARDTFTAISVPADGSVTVTYKFLHA